MMPNFWRWIVVMVAVMCMYLMHWIKCLKMIKMVSFMLRMFYHKKKKSFCESVCDVYFHHVHITYTFPFYVHILVYLQTLLPSTLFWVQEDLFAKQTHSCTTCFPDSELIISFSWVVLRGGGESAVGSWGLFLYSVNDLPSWKKKRLKDADKDDKDCLSILGCKWLLKSWEEKKKHTLMIKVHVNQKHWEINPSAV